ncbi:MAG: sodium-dependent transporter [Candidatus Methanomethylophilaceae archaeon]|nr:sodium-dependent transporter [Candidatus Methanomethylophilaceae archaeon]
MHDEAGRAAFSSKIGFVLAAAGSAVGLGNLWRFPYLAEQYGGGIFLFVYVILALLFGFALLVTELSIGRRTRKSCIDAFDEMSHKHRFIGWAAALVPMIIVPYYCVIGGWVAKYLFESASGDLDVISETGFFGEFVGCSLDGILGDPLTWFLLFALLTLLMVAIGVDKGIEKMSKVLMPILLVLIIVITVYVFTLPGSMDGAARYLVPDFSKLSAATVLGATGQLFYSMSLAMGIMITYGSYMKKDVNIESSARNISMIDTGVAILAGLMIVPAVYAFSDAGISSGPSLMFVTLPKVFDVMPGGSIIAVLFFVLVLFAALTSAISLAETVVSVLMDKLHTSRIKACAMTGILIVALGTLSCYGYGPLSGFEFAGMAFLDLFDFLSNSLLMPIVAILTCLFIGYVVKPSFVIEEIESSGEFGFKRYYGILVKVVCPILLATILAVGLLSFFGIYSI